jgi:hypothetical protein
MKDIIYRLEGLRPCELPDASLAKSGVLRKALARFRSAPPGALRSLQMPVETETRLCE